MSDTLAGIEPPVWCGLKASFIRDKGYKVRIIDADAEGWAPEYTVEKIIEIRPLLTEIVVVGTNPSASSTPKMSGVRNLLNALKDREPQIKTVLSGLHPSALPERTLQEERTDFVCQGEGFYTTLKLIEILKAGKEPADYKIEGLWFKKDGEIVSISPAPCIKSLDELPVVAWDLLPMEKYRAHNWHCFDDLEHRSPYAVIYTSLDCPFNCSYCPIHAFYGEPDIQYRSPEKVVEEIDLLVQKYNVKNIKFMDELFVIREDRVNRICDLIIEREYKLNIWVYARIDTMRESLLAKMKKAGINWIAYGIESASEIVRRGVSKKIKSKKIKKIIEMTRDAGINMIGNFIFGLPDDNLETMRETLNMAKEFNFEYVNFYVCMAYPGSKLYEEVIKNGLKLPETWDGFGQYSHNCLPLPTKYLKAEEVLRFRDNAFKEYFSNPVYLDMINKKFGSNVVEHLKKMLKHKIKRRYV
ncbi:MAG: radical SAM protein [bacterium]